MEELEKSIAAENEAAVPPKKKAGRKPKAYKLPPLELFYRQVYDLRERESYGLEVQLRINDPVMGTLLPSLFVPVAEKSKRIIELENWTLEEMLAAAGRRQEKNHPIKRFFFPVSVKYWQKPNAIPKVLERLNAAGISPSQLCLAMDADALPDGEEGVSLLGGLQDAGFSVSLGGFGMSSASLMSLGALAPDFIKLDAAFTAQLGNDARASELASSMVELAEKWGIGVIADGVEDKAALVAVQELGCRLAQGAYVGDYLREKELP